MADEKSATYSIRIETEARSVEAGAASLDQLKASLGASMDASKLLGAAMRGLKGSSDEVKDARAQLKAQLEAERGAVTQGTLALLKQGTSYEQLAQKERLAAQELGKLQKEQEKAKADALAKSVEQLKASLSAAGGPVEDVRGRVKTLGT